MAEWQRHIGHGYDLTVETAGRLEARLAADPEDLVARVQLLGHAVNDFYSNGRPPEALARIDEHVLWLSTHHPEIDLGGDEIVVFRDPLTGDDLAAWRMRWLALVEAHPTQPVLLVRAARFLRDHDPELALELARRALRLSRRSEVHVLVGELQTRLGRPEEAIAEHERALLASDADREWVRLRLAKVALDAGKLDHAAETATTLLADTNHPMFHHEAHILLGEIAFARGDRAAACDHLLAAADVHTSPELASFGPRLELASRLLQHGEVDVVLRYLEACKAFWALGAEVLDRWRARIAAGDRRPLRAFEELFTSPAEP